MVVIVSLPVVVARSIELSIYQDKK